MKKIQMMIALSLALSAAQADDTINLKLGMRDGVFLPDRLEAPTGKEIKLEVSNSGENYAEFESADLRREELVPPGGQAVLSIGPLRAGQYRIFDDINKEGRAVLVVK